MSDKIRDGQRAVHAVREKITNKFFNKSKITISMFETDCDKDNRAKKDLKVGEIYKDKDGKEWTREENGTIQSISNFIGKYTMPFFCPECKKITKGKADSKMWTYHNKCIDCVVTEETQMKINGTYDDYANKKVQANVKAWVSDMENLLKDWDKDQAQEKLQFLMNSSGDMESWDTSKTENKDKIRLEEVLQEVKTKLEENSNEV
jgi:hypothetical protein